MQLSAHVRGARVGEPDKEKNKKMLTLRLLIGALESLPAPCTDNGGKRKQNQQTVILTDRPTILIEV